MRIEIFIFILLFIINYQLMSKDVLNSPVNSPIDSGKKEPSKFGSKVINGTKLALAGLLVAGSAQAGNIPSTPDNNSTLAKAPSTLEIRDTDPIKNPAFYQEYLALKEAGKLPQNFVIKREEHLNGVDLKADLNFILADLGDTPTTEYKFEKADLVNNRGSFEKLIADIFADDKDPEKVKTWLKEGEGVDKKPASDETIKAYVDGVVKTEKRWLKAFAGWDKQIAEGVLKPNVYAEASERLNDFMDKLVHQSMTARRLGAVISLSMAYNNNLNTDNEKGAKIKSNQKTDIASNTSWYAVLTNHKNIQFTSFKYSVNAGIVEKTTQMSPNDLDNLGLSEFKNSGVDAAGVLDSYYRSGLKGVEVDERLAKSEERLAKSEERLAKSEERLANSEERLANSEVNREVSEKARSIGTKAVSLAEDISKYAQMILLNSNDPKALSALKLAQDQKIAELKRIVTDLDSLLEESKSKIEPSTIDVFMTTYRFVKNRTGITSKYLQA